MTKDKIKQLCQLLGGKEIIERNDWTVTNCPFKGNHSNGDKEPSFGISIPNSYYNCFGCGSRGPLGYLPYALRYSGNDDWEKIEKFIYENTSLFEGEYIERKEKKRLFIIPEMVLEQYPLYFGPPLFGINGKSVLEWDIRYDEEKHKIIFPVRNDRGELIEIRARNIDPNKRPKTMGLHQDIKKNGYWYSLTLVKGKAITLCEGERDAILLKQVGVNNPWACLGTLVEEQIETIQKMNTPIILFFDNDESGKKYKMKVISKCRDLFPIYHITDYCGCKDAAELVEKNIIKKALQSIEQIC